MTKRSTSEQVLKEMQARFDEITHLTDTFSQTYLNDEYASLIRQLTATLCRKRPSRRDQPGELPAGGRDCWRAMA